MKVYRYIYVSLLFFFLAASIVFNRQEFMVLAGVMLLTTLISFIKNFIVLKFIKVKIKMPATALKKDNMKGELIIHNPIFWNTSEMYCRIKITNLLTGDCVKKEYHTVVGRNHRNVLPVIFQSDYCGCMEITVEGIGMTDVWGIIKIEKSTEIKGRGNVMPDLFPQEIVMDRSYSPGETEDSFKEKPGCLSGEMYDVREYEKGDSIKNIHWKLSGKYDALMVKRLAVETDNRVLLLFETGFAKERGKPESKRMDSAAEVFMSISQNLMNLGIRHKIGWYEQAENCFHLLHISSISDEAGVLPRVLACGCGEDSQNVITHYMDLYGKCGESHIVCVVPYEVGQISMGTTLEECIITMISGTEKGKLSYLKI